MLRSNASKISKNTPIKSQSAFHLFRRLFAQKQQAKPTPFPSSGLQEVNKSESSKQDETDQVRMPYMYMCDRLKTKEPSQNSSEAPF